MLDRRIFNLIETAKKVKQGFGIVTEAVEKIQSVPFSAVFATIFCARCLKITAEN